MMRQSSSRNQRSKGFRLRHALQIGLLAAVCIWLLYQVKHSHDKRKAYEESNSSISSKIVERKKEAFSLGRKDFPLVEVAESSNETRDEEEEKEEAEEEEEKSIGQEEGEDKGGVGDDEIDEKDEERDEIDEQDRERGDEEDRVEELDGEEDKDDRDRKDYFDGLEGHDKASQEAREENYRRDDAASAVNRETQTTELEGENADARGLHEEQAENNGMKEVDVETMANRTVEESVAKNESSIGTMDISPANISNSVLATSEAIPDTNLSSKATDFKEELGIGSSKLEDGSTSNSTSVETDNQEQLQTNSTTSGSENQMGTQNNFMVLDTDTNEPQQNGTVGLDLVQDQNSTVKASTSRGDKSNLEGVVAEKANTTNVLEEAQESSPTSSATNNIGSGAEGQNGTVGLDSVQDQNSTVKASTFGEVKPNLEDLMNKKANTPTVLEEAQESSPTSLGTNEIGSAAEGENNNSSHMKEEVVAPTNLSNLPDTQNEERIVDVKAAE